MFKRCNMLQLKENTFDNFTLFPRGNDGEYSALNTLMSGSSGGSLNLLWVGK